jgi:hypothetical protein
MPTSCHITSIDPRSSKENAEALADLVDATVDTEEGIFELAKQLGLKLAQKLACTLE